MPPTTPVPVHGPGDRRLSGEDGFALAMTALLIIPLLAFVSLGIDVGAWYARAEQIQRAADAAALAAAPLTPDPVATRNAALATLQRNNIACTQFGGPVTCDMAPMPNSDIAYRVTITDPKAPQFFSQTFRGDVAISRKATAERLHPIPMGSPNNYLGTNQLLSGTPRENYWLAISGRCASKEQGDRRMTETDANWSGGGYQSCRGSNTIANAEYDPKGYTYVMSLQQAYTGTVHLEVYDPVLCDGGPGEGPTSYGGARFQFEYTVLGRAGSPDAATTLRTWTPPNTSTSCENGTDGSTSRFRNAWVSMYQFVNPAAGQYYLRIKDPSLGTVTTNRNSNQFAIRARFSGGSRPAGTVAPTTWTTCSTISGSTNPAYLANCPQVHGYRDMGVYASVDGAASFYLTDVGPDYNGRTMEITLWDPGEGAESIELLNPLGSPVRFDWESVDCGTAGITPPSGGCSGSGTVLDVDGTGAQPGPNRVSTSKYSDRPIKLTYKLPDNIATAYGGNTWWKIRYTAGGNATDRTTWSVQIPGDPVRLVPSID